MNQELPVSGWDNFTPEQKHLFQVWIKSLEDAEVASMELIKSFSEKEIAPEATSGSNPTAAENLDLVSIKGIAELPPDIPEYAILRICQAGCLLKPAPQRCFKNCWKKYGNPT